MIEVINRHDRIALSFSGGKDSLACMYLLREFLPRITVYHLDTGDLMPETHEVVAHAAAMAPNFVRIDTDVGEWIKQHGPPSDVVPYTAHPLAERMGQRLPISARYDCCFHNVMWPLYQRIKDDGCTLLIRGTKAADMPVLPFATGDVADDIEFLYPLEGWSHDDVFEYLRNVGAPIARYYEHNVGSLDCARCSAWLTDRRAAYLRQYHPTLFEDYKARINGVLSALNGPFAELLREAREVNLDG